MGKRGRKQSCEATLLDVQRNPAAWNSEEEAPESKFPINNPHFNSGMFPRAVSCGCHMCTSTMSVKGGADGGGEQRQHQHQHHAPAKSHDPSGARTSRFKDHR